MCSMAGSCSFKIFSQHVEASDGVPPQSYASESEKVLDGTQKNSPLWIRDSLPADVGASLYCSVIVDAENRRPKSIFSWASGNESGFPHSPLRLLPAQFLTFALWVFKLWLSEVLLLGCPRSSLRTHLAQPITPLGDLTGSQLLHSNPV